VKNKQKRQLGWYLVVLAVFLFVASIALFIGAIVVGSGTLAGIGGILWLPIIASGIAGGVVIDTFPQKYDWKDEEDGR
jgi:hypothetical protein